MEVIFKNRPYEGVQINPVDENRSLEIYAPKNTTGKKIIPPFRFDKKNIQVVIRGIKELIENRRNVKVENEFDKFDLSFMGPDYGPNDLTLMCNHKMPNGDWIKTGSIIQEDSAPSILKALKRWAENPNL